MSQYATEQTLINALIDEFGGDVQLMYENVNVEPKGEDFIEAFFIPVSNDSTGKAASDTQDEGIFQVTVALRKGEYQNRLLQLVDRVQNAFAVSSTLSYQGKDVYITSYSTNAGRESDGFYKRDVSIEYLTFS